MFDPPNGFEPSKGSRWRRRGIKGGGGLVSLEGRLTLCPEWVTNETGGGKIVRLVPTLTEPRVLSSEDVERIIEALADRCRGLPPVVLLYLHGAHARGTQSALSDLDLAVLLEPGAARNRRIHADVLFALEETCERDDVDMVILNTAGPIIADRVIRQGRLVYARDDRERIIFEASVIRKALDFRFFSRVYDDALFRQLREGRYLD